MNIIKSDTNSITKFNFQGDELDVLKRGETLWISLRRICEYLGLDPEAQRQKLKSKPWACTVIIKAHDISGRKQEILFIDIDSLPMWLATISTNKVRPQVKPKLISYQKEAAKVLRNHFFGTKNIKKIKEDIDILSFRRIKAASFLCEMHKNSIISNAYLSRYIDHSRALIDGTDSSIEQPRLIDVSGFMESKGRSRSEITRYASSFGKKVKALYFQKYGQNPRKVHRLVNGSERLVNSYTEEDTPLFEQIYRQMFTGRKVLITQEDIVCAAD